MRKLDINEFKLCQILGRIFELSIDLSNLSSPMFIKRFMNYDGTKGFFNKSYLVSSNNDEDIILELNETYSPNKNKVIYTKNQMYWIGYIYGALSFLYDLPSKAVYKLFPAKEIVKYYNIYHTFDIEEASERMMENINYKKEDNLTRGIRIIKKLMLQDKLRELIGKEIKVYINNPINSIKDNIIYKLNCGYIKEFKDINNDFQGAYVLGVDQPVKEFIGIVYALISRTNDDIDKLIVVNKGATFTDKEINDKVKFIEKNYRHRIIRK